MAGLESLLPLVSFIGGFASKFALDEFQGRRIHKREREARREARRDFLAQRRSDFQRANLLELQAGCMDLIRAAGQTNHLDAMEFRKSGQWQKVLLPDDLNESFRVQQASTTMLSVRIRDEEVRRLVSDLKHAAGEIARASDLDSSNTWLRSVATVHSKLNDRIGEVLRNLEDEDEQAVS